MAEAVMDTGLSPAIPTVERALGPADGPTADRYRWMVESVREVIFEADPEGRWTFLNPAWERLLGHTVLDSIGRPFLDYVHPEDRQANLDIFIDTVMGGKNRCRFEARYLMKDGGERNMEIHAWIFRAPDGTALGSTGTLTDVTDRRQAERELARLATHDHLTGLANRVLLTERITEDLLSTRQRGEDLALLFLDLDQFKLVNDSLGHDAGDEVLRIVADRLVSAAPSPASVCRFGGDEFVILCPGFDAAGARDLARTIQQSLSEPLDVRGTEVVITTSVGVRIVDAAERIDRPVEAAHILLRDGDTAMYEAKTAGRARTRIFDDASRDRVVRRLDLRADLRRALTNNELMLYYQPQVSIADRSLVGFEALLRWQHPERGLVLPDDIIPVAEESGLIVEVGRWVLDRACTDMATSIALGNTLPRIAVNVSARQLSPGFVADAARTLENTGAPAERICLELTESAVHHDLEATCITMSALANLGFELSMDDFGTGFSSLGVLQRLPLHELKIDKSFVERLDEADGRAIAIAVIALADALSMTTVAEGVESDDQLELLREFGCATAQGYLIARPAPLTQAILAACAWQGHTIEPSPKTLRNGS